MKITYPQIVPGDLSDTTEKLVYLYLERVQNASVRSVAGALDLPVGRARSALREMAERELVRQEGSRFVLATS